MKKPRAILEILLAVYVIHFAVEIDPSVLAQDQTPAAPLRLLQKLPLPGLDGALDHMAIDVHGQRLFIPAEQHGTVEVLDLRTGKRIRTISAARWPSTVIYHAPSNEIFVSDRADGTCKVFSGGTYELVRSINLLVGADNAAFDASSHSLYIATGGRHAGLPYTLIAIVDAVTKQHIGDIKVDSPNVQAMVFETSGSKMYAEMS